MPALDPFGELLPPAEAERPVPLAKLLIGPVGRLERRRPGPANPGGEAGCSNQLPGGGSLAKLTVSLKKVPDTC